MALAVTACQDNTVEPEALVHDNIMRFNLVGPSVQTKVSAGAFEAADQIGLYVTDYVNENTPMPLQISGNRANNMTVTYDGAAWTPEQTIYWGESKSDVYAYYPYISDIQDVESQYFEVAADQTGEGYEASDLLWAKAEGVRKSDGAVNLQMQHLMSKLTVKIVAGEDYIGSLPEDASVLLHSTVTGARLDLFKGSVSKDPYSGAKSITMKNLGVRTFDGEKAVVYEAIVVPQMLENSVPLLEINSKSVSYLLEDPFNFRPGVAYTYTVTLNTSTTAIKVEIGCELEDWNSTGGNSGEGEEGGEGSEGGEDGKTYTDLSAAGSANCYLIQGAGDYKFKTVIGNTDATVGNVKSVEVLWESFGTDEMPNVGDLIASVSYENGDVRFSTPENFRDGNALIAAKNSKGAILWSWHIWCAEEGWKEQVYYNDAGTMMDRNLGATSAIPNAEGSLGLMYQWGRKDPFMGPAQSSGIMAQATGSWSYGYSNSKMWHDDNPMTFDGSSGSYANGWDSEKTIWDPCPSGWRIPDGSDNGIWATAAGSAFSNGHTTQNFSGIFGDDEVIWYPKAGRISFNVFYDVLTSGYYWSSSDYNILYKYSFIINSSSAAISNSNGASVRCCKE